MQDLLPLQVTPLGGCSVSPQLFGLLTREILKLATETARGRVLLALEGGYNVNVLADCVEDVMAALVDEAREGVNELAKSAKLIY